MTEQSSLERRIEFSCPFLSLGDLLELKRKYQILELPIRFFRLILDFSHLWPLIRNLDSWQKL